MEKVRFQDMGTHFDSTYELKKLQKQNEKLRLENKILKKFQAFLKQKNV